MWRLVIAYQVPKNFAAMTVWVNVTASVDELGQDASDWVSVLWTKVTWLPNLTVTVDGSMQIWKSLLKRSSGSELTPAWPTGCNSIEISCNTGLFLKKGIWPSTELVYYPRGLKSRCSAKKAVSMLSDQARSDAGNPLDWWKWRHSRPCASISQVDPEDMYY